MSDAGLRQAVRQTYEFRCGYCGVHEDEAGSLLEIDHFKPRSSGGTDDLENLVYCCSTCNRLKGDWWPENVEQPESKRILHPKTDVLSIFLEERPDGTLAALNSAGRFHLDRLRLNRPPLVALRQSRKTKEKLIQELSAVQEENKRLKEVIVRHDEETRQVLKRIAQLLGTDVN